MKLRRLLASALRPLAAHPLRTMLALSGVAIGVGAVVVSRAISDGAQQEMAATVGTLGTSLLIVKPLPARRLVARPQVRGFATTLRLEDAAAIARLPQVSSVAPAIEDAGRVTAGPTTLRTTVRGSTAAYLRLRRFELAAGRFLEAGDEQAARRVAVLGARVARQLFPSGTAVGRELRVRGIPFEIIGVLRAKGTTTDSADQDNQVLVPLTTAQRRLFNIRWLTSAYIGVAEPGRLAAAEAEITALLRARHRGGGAQPPDDFAVQSTAKTRAIQEELTASLSRYAAGLGAITLLVGGTGVLAQMFLSVRERTSEIGLRLAVGAQPRDILLQFLIEAMCLALAGWGAGIVLGGGVTIVVAVSTNWEVGVPVSAAATALVAALGIGLGFGTLPARSAARIPPIQALTKK